MLREDWSSFLFDRLVADCFFGSFLRYVVWLRAFISLDFSPRVMSVEK